jgi:hypothetical protein
MSRNATPVRARHCFFAVAYGLLGLWWDSSTPTSAWPSAFSEMPNASFALTIQKKKKEM